MLFASMAWRSAVYLYFWSGPLFLRRINPYYMPPLYRATLPEAKTVVVSYLDIGARSLPQAFRRRPRHKAAQDLAQADLESAINCAACPAFVDGWRRGRVVLLLLPLCE